MLAVVCISGAQPGRPSHTNSEPVVTCQRTGRSLRSRHDIACWPLALPAMGRCDDGASCHHAVALLLLVQRCWPACQHGQHHPAPKPPQQPPSSLACAKSHTAAGPETRSLHGSQPSSPLPPLPPDTCLQHRKVEVPREQLLPGEGRGRHRLPHQAVQVLRLCCSGFLARPVLVAACHVRGALAVGDIHAGVVLPLLLLLWAVRVGVGGRRPGRREG